MADTPGGPGQERYHAARLGALGYLLERRRYARDGLAILAVGGGFAVTGLCRPSRWRRAAVPCAETITAAELDALIAARGR